MNMRPEHGSTDSEMEQARSAFIEALREQVNTPLTLMLGTLRESLTDDRLPSKERYRVALAHRAALRLLNLVDCLDDLSRIELRLTRPSEEVVDLCQVVMDVVTPYEDVVKLAGLRLAVDGDKSGAVVRCDRDLLERALLHLVSNAFKHTRQGEIRVRVARVGEAAEVSVVDTGIGIPEHELPRVFERFYRVRGAWARTGEASGLGLALVKAVAESHGGAVRVESRPGIGSSFTISLPVAPPGARVPSPGRTTHLAAHLADEAAAHMAALPEEDGRTPRPPPAVRSRIVLIEESADLRAHLLRVLGREWNVVAFDDGAEALDRIERNPPDLVLAEVVVSGLDGLGLLRALRARPATAVVPVMLIASRPGEEAAVDALEHGPDDYLVKPFSSRLLVARIRANLASARARKRHQAQLQASLEISRATLAGEGTDAVLQLVAHRARDLLEADGAYVAIPGAGQGRVLVSVGEACGSADVAALFQQGGDWVSEEAAGGRLLVVAPLAVQDRRIGLLGVCRNAGGDPFGPDDGRLLALFANQAALAMEQGRVHQEMQRLAVMEEERGRIARDIHDDTLQSLGAIALRLSLVAKRVADDGQRHSIEGLMDLTRDSAERLRTLVFDLRADVLKRGLVKALQAYVFDAPTPLPMRCSIDSRLTGEPPMHVSLVLYRVAQEALTNVHKHAQATSARLTLDEARGGVRLQVHDDGRGFDSAAGPAMPGHVGLAGMRERTELAGGTFSIESSAGRGTTVQVWIPVDGMQPRAS